MGISEVSSLPKALLASLDAIADLVTTARVGGTSIELFERDVPKR